MRIGITGKRRHFDEANLLEVINASPDRVVPRCAHFGVCGGCSLQHLAPAAQIVAKQRVLAENLERIGKVEPESWLDVLADEPWGYRRKGRLSVKYVEKKERLLVGFRETNGRYVADIQRCEVLHPAVGHRIEELSGLIADLDAVREIPQIEVAVGDATVALIFRHLKPLSEKDQAALVAFAKTYELGIYLQPGGLDSVHPLWPLDMRLHFTLPEQRLEIDFQPLDFIQVNAGMNRRMVNRALTLLEPQSDDRVLDLFCGLGNFTLPIARHVAQVVGVEGDAGLVARANANARLNEMTNAEFFAADLLKDQRGSAWLSGVKSKYSKLLLDPPRTGAASVLEWLPLKSLRRIVYVSCHPASLARDAGVLVHQHTFRLRNAGVMDMFPHTAHVESIALFERD